MAERQQDHHGTISRRALVGMILAGGALTLGLLTGLNIAWVSAVSTAITDGTVTAIILLAAGGFGHLALRKLFEPHVSAGLRATTCCAAGLWMLSTAVLVVGSLTRGLLTPWVWWPVLAVGGAAAMWCSRRRFNAWKVPERFDGRALLWVLMAIAVGFWLGGATLAPNIIPADSYDVLAYHLQGPREFYDAGQITELRHNCYSYYPLGLEMLFLLGMCLHGGTYRAVYTATLLHGAFDVLAVGAVFLALRREGEARARFSAALLATTPLLLYLSWLAMVELTEVCYLALALLWLRLWLADRSARAAVAVGLMLGAGCAMKYLAVGFLLLPVGAMMLIFSIWRARDLAHVGLAAVAAAALFAPWLIRNVAYTGNPVFPLATQIFGRGHWSPESEQRWLHGHGPRAQPPVPQPPGYQMPPAASRLRQFYVHFLLDQRFGQVLLIIAALAICALVAQRGPPDRWAWSLVGVLAIQCAVWTAWTHDMPPRFLAPAVVPICLLAGRALASLARVQVNPFRRAARPSAKGPWGVPPAVATFAIAAGVNLLVAYGCYHYVTGGRAKLHGVPAEMLTVTSLLPKVEQFPELPADVRFLMVGNAMAFFFPPGTIYATPFDAHPLAEMVEAGAGPPQILAQLRRQRVTHIWVDWTEIWRLAQTYGYPGVLSTELFDRWHRKARPGLAVLDGLVKLGARPTDLAGAGEFEPPLRWQQDAQPPSWPRITVYTMPWVAPPATAPATRPATTAATATAPSTQPR